MCLFDTEAPLNIHCPDKEPSLNPPPPLDPASLVLHVTEYHRIANVNYEFFRPLFDVKNPVHVFKTFTTN